MKRTTLTIFLAFHIASSSGFQRRAISNVGSSLLIQQKQQHQQQLQILRPTTTQRQMQPSATIRSPAILTSHPCNTMMKLRARGSSSSSSLYSSKDLVSSDDDRRMNKNEPTVVYALILASVISFVADNILRNPICRNMYMYHSRWKWYQPLTSTFCHASRSHLSGNVFLLLLFGRSVEDELGPFGLLFSYIFCGVVSNLVSLALLPSNTVSIGASGAVFGLFAVSIFSRISWRDSFNWRKFVEVGVLGQFVVSRLLEEAKTAASGGVTGINHVAHLSGAGAGVLMILLLRVLIDKLEKK